MLHCCHTCSLPSGYRLACDVAKERLESLALNRAANKQAFRQDLLNIAKTTLRCVFPAGFTSVTLTGIPALVTLSLPQPPLLSAQNTLVCQHKARCFLNMQFYSQSSHSKSQCILFLNRKACPCCLQFQDLDARQSTLCRAGSGCCAEAERQQQPGKHTHHQEGWRHPQGCCQLKLCAVLTAHEQVN